MSTALELGINTDLSQANNQTDKLKDINKALSEQQHTAKQRRNDWGTSGTNKRITDTITNVLTTAIAGGVSTGFDVYNGEANYEKTLANFALAGIKAGKSTSQQLSIDAIYNGLTLANDKTKSDEEVKDLSISKIVGSVASISIDYGFKSNGIGKQVITNVIGNYIENRVSETIKNNKKKDGGKID